MAPSGRGYNDAGMPSPPIDLGQEKVLVTGADGFIGSHLAEELARRGVRVRAFVLYNSRGSWGWLDESRFARVPSGGIEIFAGDIRDPVSAAEAVRGCGVILNLAALIAIPYSYRSPDSYVDTNVGGTLNLLNAARGQKIRRFVQVSTSEVYGTARSVPISEAHPLSAQSPYAATKIASDQLALSFHRSFGVPVSVIRPFNTYGPRQSARAVIPTIITQLLSGRTTLRLGAIDPTRDFSYVQDTVTGLIAGAERAEAVGETINLGAGFDISIGETARLIAEAMGISATIECDEERVRPAASEVGRLLADNRLAAKLLGWKPAFGGVEGFRRGLDETIAWFRQPENQHWYQSDRYQL